MAVRVPHVLLFLLLFCYWPTSVHAVPAMDPGWSTVLGGWSDFDKVHAAAVGPDGCIYLAGETASSDFPVTPGVFGSIYHGGYSDAFVIKLDASGCLIYCTLIGGQQPFTTDAAYGIAVDPSGFAYVVGYTTSPDFPTTPGAYKTVYADTWGTGGDAFITKLSPDGSTVIYSTLLGGNNGWYGDRAFAVAVDSSGSVYVGGTTDSSDFPTTPGALDTVMESYNREGFIARLDPTGSTLVYSTFIGGSSGSDSLKCLVLDQDGCVYAGGETSAADFPVTPGAADSSLSGLADGFVLKLNAGGSALLYATFIGGSGRRESVNGIDVDWSGSVYAAGITDSADFPVTSQAYDSQLDGDTDAFAVKLNASGSAFEYSTFIGGDDREGANGIAVDPSGNAHIVGYTDSSDFPTTPGSYDEQFNGEDDAFLFKISPDGSGLVYSTFIGGGLHDDARAVMTPGTDLVYVVGQTESSDFPVSLTGHSSNGSSSDIFALKLGEGGSLPVLVIGDSPGGTTDPPAGGYVYPPGSSVSVSATPAPGYTFERWQGGVTDPYSSYTTVYIDVSKYIAPVFISSAQHIGDIIRLPDKVWVVIPFKPVTAVFDDGFYIEEEDRSAGIRVISSVRPSKTSAAVYGEVATVGPEKVIHASSVVSGGPISVAPLFMPNRCLGGHMWFPQQLGFSDPAGLSSLYNLGLLVRTTGCVTYVDPSGKFMYIDDGSCIVDANKLAPDGTSVSGIRVEVPAGMVLPPTGNYVVATGVSGATTVNDAPARLLRVDSHEDTRLLSGGMIVGNIFYVTGQTLNQMVESPHPYPDNYSGTWTVMGPQGITRMRLHFTKIELESRFDFLYVKDSKGEVKETYSLSVPIYDVWTSWIEDSSVTLNLTSDGSINYYGFQIDQFEVETVIPIPGVSVTLSPVGQTVSTNASGVYFFSGLGPGTYTVTPSLNGYTFSPPSAVVNVGEGQYVPQVDFQRN